ncbi:MAG: recombination regulator RecX [Lachnospiraceae bacterium]|nr:recombination regulator RecX [Lachnospiraceae bacterium]
MIITEIIEVSKTKVKVCVDNDVSFALYKNELRKFGIEKDSGLSQEMYDEIMDEVLLKRAKLRCMNLLKSRDYTEYQLVTKLKQGLYPEEIISAAVAYVRSFGYVDDIRFAKSYIQYAGQSKSKRQIENTLLRKGISKENIRQAYAQCTEENCITEEEELIIKLLEKKHFDRQNATYEECQKMVGFLYRKGFVLDEIYRVVGSCCSLVQ